MPKLSAYVAATSSTAGPGQQQQQAPAGRGGGAAHLAAAAPLAAGDQQQPRDAQHLGARVAGAASPLTAAAAAAAAAATGQAAQAPGLPSSSGGAPLLDQQHDAAAAKLAADYSKRLREHGPRTFRWPDGSLRPDRPPPNPYAVANRQQWAPLVQHCRTHGGDRAYERTGASLRHGLGVPYEQHEASMDSIGLQPETTAGGDWVGEVPSLEPPLQDPQHAFNTYYKEAAEAVFKHKLGRLL
ncbi:hypothetical protein C2E21_2783 [Chlorella sorokiniana]|uniref:Uncharacterized protein n=1 Tax=Chlorella sorokiniana TaxID=3076 RepID=A0A2P6TXB1_CHLSO|nr:hypothetical protein C2E21_2783 [Chlorella sorokiniana]|eukprot:PRW58699.1 hypothetical protein C2E21_2783 [Chlorella sorokiniana]